MSEMNELKEYLINLGASKVGFADVNGLAKESVVKLSGEIRKRSDETINNLAHYISSSKFVKTNLTPIMDMLLSNIDLENPKIIYYFVIILS